MLFPECAPASDRLIGIAKLAAQSPTIEAKRRVDYRELESKSYIARCTSPRMPFRYMINPYRGCEFGCKYCYARSTHEFMELRDPSDFETRIYAKAFPTEAFRQELRAVGRGESIALGTATDPYQPAERRFQHTRRILEVFARERGFQLSITTKSDLIARDADLLREIAARNSVIVNMTVTTTDAALARAIEPYAPRPDLRLMAVAKLAGAAINTGVFASPLMPAINDAPSAVFAVAQAARQAGAVRFGGRILYLQPMPREVFLPFVHQRFPALAPMYEKLFARDVYIKGVYGDQMRELIHSAGATFGFPNTMPLIEDDQLALF